MDLLIRNGTVVTAGEISHADVGIEAGLVKQIGKDLGPAAKEIDATGCYLFPGGVDVHTHVDIELMGHRSVDDFYSGTVAAACGGVTTIVDYAMPEPGQSIQASVEAWQNKAQDKAIIDYGLHPAILEPTPKIIAEMADAVAEGHTSFKLFMIGLARFDELASDYLKAIAEAGKHGALTNIHAEDQCLIGYLCEQMTAQGKRSVKHFPDSRPRQAEGLAVQRAVTMAQYAEAPIYLVHLSCQEALAPIREARARGQIIYGETRPLYLHLSRERFEEDDAERYVGWPPLREASQMQVMWDGLRNDNLQTVATDHCGWNLVQKAVGSDADIVIFAPNKDVTIRHRDMHSRVDYELYEGFQVTGWPTHTLSRGEVIIENGHVLGNAGRGKLLKRQRFTPL